MAVKVKRVPAAIKIVQTNFNNRIVIKYKGVCVDTVDYRVLGVTSGGQGRVECGHLLLNVGDIVEYSSINNLD